MFGIRIAPFECVNVFVSTENGLNDVTCDATSALNSGVERTASDLHIFVETSWPFIEIQTAIGTLLDNLDVNRFGTRFTLYNANDASVIVNTTSSMSDLFMRWNQWTHAAQPAGFNLAAIVKKLREIGTSLLNEEHSKSQAGGRSFVGLVVPQLSPVNEADSNYVIEQLVSLRENQPDLTLLFWSGGSVGRFQAFVVNQQRDLFSLSSSSGSGADASQQVLAYTLPVIQRIRSGTVKSFELVIL